MIEPIILLTFMVGLISGLLGGITGAGGGLIVAPYLILIGLPPSSAVATPKLAGVGVGIGSLLKFRNTSYIDMYWVKRLLPITLVAALLGSLLLLRMPEWLIKIISLGFSIEIAIQLLIDRKTGLVNRKTSKNHQKIGYILYSVVETLRGAIGSGIGTLNLAIMMSLFGMEAVSANAVKRFVTFPSFVVSLAVIIPNGLISWGHGLALLLGTAIGGYVGAHIAIEKGSLFVKRAFLVVVVILAITALIM